MERGHDVAPQNQSQKVGWQRNTASFASDEVCWQRNRLLVEKDLGRYVVLCGSKSAVAYSRSVREDSKLFEKDVAAVSRLTRPSFLAGRVCCVESQGELRRLSITESKSLENVRPWWRIPRAIVDRENGSEG